MYAMYAMYAINSFILAAPRFLAELHGFKRFYKSVQVLKYSDSLLCLCSYLMMVFPVVSLTVNYELKTFTKGRREALMQFRMSVDGFFLLVHVLMFPLTP